MPPILKRMLCLGDPTRPIVSCWAFSAERKILLLVAAQLEKTSSLALSEVRLMVRCPLIGFTVAVGLSSGVLWAAPERIAAGLESGAVSQVTGIEAISLPYVFEVDISTERSVTIAKMVGAPVSFTAPGGRSVTGIIESIEQTGLNGKLASFHLRVVPRLRQLAYRVGSRTFSEKNVIEIVQSVLVDGGGIKLESRVKTTPPKRAIAVQYRESELSFVSRLLESEGIHYHFEQRGTDEVLVLGDDNSAFAPLAPSKVTMSTGSGGVSVFRLGLALLSGKVQLGDYSWEKPTLAVNATATYGSFSELVERLFPGGVEDLASAKGLARVRQDARTAAAQQCRGQSTVPQVRAGYRFTLVGHSVPSFNQEYVVTRVEHRYGATGYENAFSCVPVNVGYRPPMVTPVPVVSGVVSGIVVGPTGVTKHVDKYGRVRLRYPWRSPEQTTQNDPGDAGWVRVAQLATGSGPTSMWLPDVGEEVAVAFEHGDPDRPVVIGSLYNGSLMPPLGLPGAKHTALLRVKSDKGVDSELLYDNTPGKEALVLRSGEQTIYLRQDPMLPAITLSAGDQLVTVSSGDVTLRSGSQFLTVGREGITSSSPIKSTGKVLVNPVVPVTPKADALQGATRPK